MDAKHKGAHSELAACVWLLEQGYEVFRNVSQHGTTDMIALKHDCTLRVDVKTAQQYTMKDGTVKHYCKHPAVRGVRILAALSNGDFVWADQMPQNRPKVHE
jgi:Holliday junction resolvase